MYKPTLALILPSVVILTLLAGCAGGLSEKNRLDGHPVPELQAYAASVLNSEELATFEVPFALDPALVAEAKRIFDVRLSNLDNARRIAEHIMRKGSGLGVTYSRHSNYTATEVAKHRTANCISFANLFVGMARAVGIDANYAEVTQVDSFDRTDGTIVYNTHVCAVVFRGAEHYLIDFSLRNYPQYRVWKTMNDVEALSTFYNNKGSFKLLEGNTAVINDEAERYFNMALKLDPNSAQAYNNIGIIRLREGDIHAAESMYKTAIEVRPDYIPSYSNLSKLYRAEGHHEEAIALMETIVQAQPGNLYAYTALARMYMEKEDFDTAEKTLKKALEREKDFAVALYELGSLYQQLGQTAKAAEQFALARRFAPESYAPNK